MKKELESDLEDLMARCRQQGLRFSSRRYRQMAAEGKLPAVKGGKVDGPLAMCRIAVYYQEMARRKQENPNLTSQQIRLTRANADRKEQELAKELESVISAAEAQFLWGEIMQNMRNRLKGLPDELASALTGCSCAADAETITRRVIHDVLTELSNPNLAEICSLEMRSTTANKNTIKPRVTTSSRLINS